MFRSGTGLRTGGPDGWRKADVTSLHDSLLQDVVNLFACIQQGGGWPVQLTRGHVTCLQKKLGSHVTANYRPIVVFSLWYRLWGCLRAPARQNLAQLEQIADFPAFGFLAGRGCKDVTFAIQAAVETALKQGSSCCGALFDIEKCLNCLPVPRCFSLRLGSGWILVLSMRGSLFCGRCFFVVHNMPSEAITSNHGFPEGDSMSCVAMVLLNFSHHFYFHHFQPQVMEVSYVDNLELMGDNPGQIIAGTATLQAWAELFRLSIDARKSSC